MDQDCNFLVSPYIDNRTHQKRLTLPVHPTVIPILRFQNPIQISTRSMKLMGTGHGISGRRGGFERGKKACGDKTPSYPFPFAGEILPSPLEATWLSFALPPPPLKQKTSPLFLSPYFFLGFLTSLFRFDEGKRYQNVGFAISLLAGIHIVTSAAPSILNDQIAPNNC